jgi:hypothetical protein
VTEIEAHVCDWLVDLLGLPREWKTAVGPGGGVIQMSASDSTHVAHAVARQMAVERGASTTMWSRTRRLKLIPRSRRARASPRSGTCV